MKVNALVVMTALSVASMASAFDIPTAAGVKANAKSAVDAKTAKVEAKVDAKTAPVDAIAPAAAAKSSMKNSAKAAVKAKTAPTEAKVDAAAAKVDAKIDGAKKLMGK